MKKSLKLATLLLVASPSCTTLKVYQGWRLGYFPQPDTLLVRRSGEYMIQPDGETVIAATFMEYHTGMDSQVYVTVLIEVPSDSMMHLPVTLIDPVAVKQRRSIFAMVTEERAIGGRVLMHGTRQDAVHVSCDLEFAGGRFIKEGDFKRSASPKDQLWPSSVCPDSLSSLRLRLPPAGPAK